jgi:hypothetical protein
MSDQLVVENAACTKHNRRTSMPSTVFGVFPAVKWLQIYALDRTATGFDNLTLFTVIKLRKIRWLGFVAHTTERGNTYTVLGGET